MIDLAMMRKAMKYWRTWGVRAASRRAAAELRNALRRRLGGARPEAASFDAAVFTARLEDSALRLVVFDVFDTLVERPLLDPAEAFGLIAQRIGKPHFAERRRAAEHLARDVVRRDVGLADVYRAYVDRFGSGDGDAVALQRIEEDFECALALPRLAGLELLGRVRAHAVPFVLASDTVLPAAVLTRIADEVGVVGHARIYASSDCGVRKSTGQLFERILQDFQVQPHEVLVIGDHPLSDWRIPQEMGLHCAPLEAARDIAQRFARFSKWSASTRGEAVTDPAREMLAGLLCRQAFSGLQPVRDRAALTQGGRFGIGYGVLGPIIVAFSDWLAMRARADGMRRLYFVAREGKFLRTAFRRLHGDTEDVPEDRYLVVSRRAVSVASIETADDIAEVAATAYLAGPLEDYLYLRFGLEVTEPQLAAWDHAGLWRRGQPVEVSAGRIEALRPLLDALTDVILARAAEERCALMAYLAAEGVCAAEPAALVDVGYAASTQARLGELCGRPVHGYYLLTRHVAAAVRERHGVIADGCFAHDIATPEDAPMLRYCLAIELMLGADDPQVTHYRLDAAGCAEPQHLPLSAAEQGSAALRAELRDGALAFVDDWRLLRARTGLALVLAPADVVALFKEFWEGIGESERASLDGICGDDHYCGRGVIGFRDLFGSR